ncbi:MAG: hypothetical protein FWG27_04680 [Treponema sp.]|nr:hypothetical protein [Treponema sp.]
MTDYLSRTAEEWFGIKADPDDIKKLRSFLWDTCGEENPETIAKVFSSGEAADFLTVNETYFFREPVHFTFLRDLLPSFEKTGVQICSAAAASGCEAYSIAMMIESYNKGIAASLPYHIDAFDINPKVIETARQGIYGLRSLREDGSCFRYLTDPYLEKLKDGYRVVNSLKKNISFFVHNLLDQLPPKEYDIIFFRNAFIYLSPRHRDRVLSNLSSALNEEGILILGVSETAGMHYAGLAEKNRNEVFYFQKPKDISPCRSEQREEPAPETACIEKAGKGRTKPGKGRKKELCFDAARVEDILSCEKKPTEIAGRILRILEDQSHPGELDGNDMVISILHLLKQGDFFGAGSILDYMEALDDSSITAFLRGEYFFLQDLFTDAELYYRISLAKNDAFWPAGYRLCSLSSADAVKKHRAAKALEGLCRGRDLQYEVLIGGFSPDYYTGALLKQKVE